MILIALGAVLYGTMRLRLEAEMDRRLEVRATQVELSTWPGTQSLAAEDLTSARLDLESPLESLRAPGVFVRALDRFRPGYRDVQQPDMGQPGGASEGFSDAAIEAPVKAGLLDALDGARELTTADVVQREEIEELRRCAKEHPGNRRRAEPSARRRPGTYRERGARHEGRLLAYFAISASWSRKTPARSSGLCHSPDASGSDG